MPRGSRDGQKPPHDNGQPRPTHKERRKHPRRLCDLPVRMVVAEPPAAEAGAHLVRVNTRCHCDIWPEWVIFATDGRIRSEDFYLRHPAANHWNTFQTARAVRSQKLQDGHWRYGASFVEPGCRVDRYEFD